MPFPHATESGEAREDDEDDDEEERPGRTEQLHRLLQKNPCAQEKPISHCSPGSRTRFPHAGTTATAKAEELLLLSEENWAQMQEAVQMPVAQGRLLSHCSSVSRILLPQTGPREETEECAEEAMETLGAQRHRKLLHSKPVGHALIPRSHSSSPSSLPLPQRGLAETAEEEDARTDIVEEEESDSMIVSVLQR